jgi:hypothetical protein
VVKFGHAGKDNLGRLKVKSVAGFVVERTDEYKQIVASLTNFKAAAGKKRSAPGPEEASTSRVVGDADEEERRKRRKIKGFGILGFLGAPSAVAQMEQQQDEDEDMENAFD